MEKRRGKKEGRGERGRERRGEKEKRRGGGGGERERRGKERGLYEMHMIQCTVYKESLKLVHVNH